MLAEVWRVLAGGGRLVVVVPNRRGIWARLDRTPFGGGHPYTAAQLSKLLRETAFTPTLSTTALYLPPTTRRMMLSAAGAWEGIGERWFTTFAGLVVIEATKQIYARPKPSVAPRRRGVYQPAPTPV
jgi:hypothetical protein